MARRSFGYRDLRLRTVYTFVEPYYKRTKDTVVVNDQNGLGGENSTKLHYPFHNIMGKC